MILMMFVGEYIISICMKVPEDNKIKFKAIALGNNTTMTDLFIKFVEEL